MNPLPVTARVPVPAYVDAVSAIGVRVATESNTAGVCAAPPHWPVSPSTKDGPTQNGSAHVSFALFLSPVDACVVAANPPWVRIPQEALIPLLNGTCTW